MTAYLPLHLKRHPARQLSYDLKACIYAVIKRETGTNCRPCTKKMTDYAADNRLQMTGYAYEMGLNEFAISSQEDYATEIMIQVV